MKQKTIEKQIKAFKTPCCKAEWIIKGRSNYRCKKCDEDVTLEIILFYQALIKK